MSAQNDIGFRTFLGGGASTITAFLAVDVQSDGSITPASGGSTGIGVTQEDVPVGYYGNVKLWSAPGTFMLSVSGSAVTPANSYAIITGGYAGAVATGSSSGVLKGLYSGVASDGIVLEFASLN